MTDDRFRAKLAEQLGFIERSCAAFDDGHREEGIRIATCIRVIMHQTKNSTSLLAHLGADSIHLLNTAPPSNADLYFEGMGTYRKGPKGMEFVPKLTDFPRVLQTEAMAWWEQIVMRLNATTALTRKAIVLDAANKDGGAHVDETLSREYELLATPGSMATYIYTARGKPDVVYPIPEVHLVCLRQMGYEILNSTELIALTRPQKPEAQ